MHIFLGFTKMMQIIVPSALQYETYKIHKYPEGFYSFIFNDIMGLEKDSGVHVEDVKLAMRGHVTEGYEV